MIKAENGVVTCGGTGKVILTEWGHITHVLHKQMVDLGMSSDFVNRQLLVIFADAVNHTETEDEEKEADE